MLKRTAPLGLLGVGALGPAALSRGGGVGVTVIPFTPLIQVLGGWYTFGLINMFYLLIQ